MTIQPIFDEYTTRDFPLKGGGHISELRQGFITLGEPKRDSAGDISNAVLLLHNTTGDMQWTGGLLVSASESPYCPRVF